LIKLYFIYFCGDAAQHLIRLSSPKNPKNQGVKKKISCNVT